MYALVEWPIFFKLSIYVLHLKNWLKLTTFFFLIYQLKYKLLFDGYSYDIFTR